MPKFTEDKLEQAIILLNYAGLPEQREPESGEVDTIIADDGERKHGYPPIDRDRVYKEIFEQAENFMKYRPTAS